MVDSLKPVISRPGMYRAPATAPETSPGSGVYSLTGGVETSPGSGVYAFPEGPAFEVSTTAFPPSARLVFDPDDLPSGTHTITVTRSYEGVTERLRSAWNRFAAGGAILTDSEIPLGVPVSYRAEAFDTSGVSMGVTGEVTVQVDSDPSRVWISDPTNPALVVQADAPADFAEDMVEVREVQTYQIGNRVVPEVKKTRTGSINDIQYGGGWANWEMTGQEVSVTTLDILVPSVTWQLFIDSFPGASWQDVIDLYAGKTWFDVIAEFSAGGA